MISLPAHLKKYIISQEDHRYSFVEQATWRYILNLLTQFLSEKAHEAYTQGLAKTGITLNKIPQIKEISKHLEPLGWVAMPVSGFIPPSAFMELQSLGILPIATEMRSFEHLLYTPAPDIVHEAAGHAPMLAHPEYSDYLKSYAKVSRRAILSKQDLSVYRSIRILSDLKENPSATTEQIKLATQDLEKAQASVSYQSEAALLARMNWWTAEYGLIGDLKSPKIYGAGLLSSVGESKSCFDASVRKIPLSIDCINYSYDITEPQPQLFVTPSFAHLKTVLEEFSKDMAYQVGGIKALQKAQESKAVTTCQMDSLLEVGGIVKTFKRDNEGRIAFIKWTGPCQLAVNERELSGQGCQHHPQGFSSPMGLLEDSLIPPHDWSDQDWLKFGFKENTDVTFNFVSGVKVTGHLKTRTIKNGKTLLITLEKAHVTYKEETLFDPSWGVYDMALGTQIKSVWGGAPDRVKFPEQDDFEFIQIPKKIPSSSELQKDKFYETIHLYRTGQKKCKSKSDLLDLKNCYYESFARDPLFDWEIEQIEKTL